MGEWRETTLGELVEGSGGSIQTGPFGSALHASDYVELGVPSVMPANIGDNVIVEEGIARITEADARRLGRHRLEVGDIVYSRRGDVERRAFVREENSGWLCGTGCLRVHFGSHEGVDPQYVSYALGTEWTREWIVQNAVGATMLNLNTGILSRVPLVAPPVDEQRAIAEVLGALDDKIAANTRLAATAQELARASFRPLIRSAKERIRLGDLITVTKGVSYRSADLVESDTAMVTLKCFRRGGGYAEGGLKAFAGAFKDGQAVLPGEIAVAQTDLTQAADVIGQAVRVPAPGGFSRLVASLDVAVVRPRGAVSSDAILGILEQDEFRSHCRARTSGTTVLHLERGAIESYMAPQIDREVLSRCAERAGVLRQSADAAAAESVVLSRLRDALLPQLMSGKLRVREAAEMAGL